MRDAARNKIIYSKISKRMTVKTLYNPRHNDCWTDQLVKWYRPPLDEMTEGISIHRLAQELEKKSTSPST